MEAGITLKILYSSVKLFTEHFYNAFKGKESLLMPEDKATIIGWIATLCTIIQYLSVSFSTTKDVFNRKSSNEFSSFPFIVMTVSNLVWLKYGILKYDNPIIWNNATGMFLNIATLMVFYAFSSSKSLLHKQLFFAFLVVTADLNYLRFIVNNENEAIQNQGYLCLVMSVLSYASPLSALRDVCRQKSTLPMSFTLIFFNIILAIEWLIYGIMIGDSALTLPNLLGLVLSCFQISLFAMYPSVKSTVVKRRNLIIAA